MDIDFTPTPHEEAARLIAGKPVVSRTVFDKLLPEVKARAFTISGVESAGVMQRVRELIADLPRGENWETVKSSIIAELEPYLGEGAERRAILLLRTHGFQAFQAANWRVAQEDEDTTHMQYLATEDGAVRATHLALNGVVLPKNDPFWEKHYPPWEFGCRCRIRPMNPDLVDMERELDKDRNPEDRNVIEGAVLEKLRQGTLLRDGRAFNVQAPSEQGKEGAYEWNPDSLRMPVDALKARVDPEVWTEFSRWAETSAISPGVTVAGWLQGRPPMLFDQRLGAPVAQESIVGQGRVVDVVGIPARIEGGKILPVGPRNAFQFAEERVRAAEAAERKNDSKAKLQEAAAAADKTWKARTVTANELEPRLAAMKQNWPEQQTYEEVLRELRSGEISKQWPAQAQQSLARLRVEQTEELQRHWALAELYKAEHPAGQLSEAIARWSVAGSRRIEEKYQRLRGKVWNE